MKERIRIMVRMGIRQFADPYYQGFAAQIAFYLLLSIVPTVIILMQILNVLGITSLDFLFIWLDRYVTPNMAATLKAFLENRSSTGNNIILIAMAMWSASRAQFALMRIANYTYSSGRTTGNFFKERWRSLGTMSLTVLTLVFVVVILVYGQMILRLVFGRVIQTSMISRLWSWLRWPLALVLYFLVIVFDYYLLPLKKMNVRDLLPGSIMASVSMLVVTVFYSIYTNYVVDYGLIYGSLSSVAAVLFWLYLLSWVLVLGILFNKLWRDTRDMKARKENE